jgi:tyrosine decarboxylase/aspartate 1-decarboxylase
MVCFPKNGLSDLEIESQLAEYQKRSALYRFGKNWGMGFYPADVGINAYLKFLDSNMIYAALGAGNPFPGITDMEAEVVSMMGSVFGNEDAKGNITIGGTEANIIALKVARDTARRKKASVVMATTAHPSFIKGCHLMGLEAIRVPVDEDYRVSPKRMREAVREDTIAIVSTCGTHTHGTIDPVDEIGKVAEDNELYHHVDAAWGGLICCWLRKINEYDVPAFDFTIPSVRSMTVDPHKQGFTPMPAGGILFRDEKLHSAAAFEFIDEMHGHYFSWTLQGSRTGGPIAAVWALFNHFGEEGYIKLSRKCMELTYKLVKGIRAIPGLRIPVEPKMNIFAVHPEDYDVNEVVSHLEKKGWTGLYITQDPPSFRCVVLPHHEKQIQPFLNDLEEATKQSKRVVLARA